MEGSKVDSCDGALAGRSERSAGSQQKPLGLEISKRYWLETSIAKPSARNPGRICTRIVICGCRKC